MTVEAPRATLTPDPGHRLRRLRRTSALRALVRETRIHPRQLVAPLFVQPGRQQRTAISSLPGVEPAVPRRGGRRGARAGGARRRRHHPVRPAGLEGLDRHRRVDRGRHRPGDAAADPRRRSRPRADRRHVPVRVHGPRPLRAGGRRRLRRNDDAIASLAETAASQARGRGRRRRPERDDGRPGRGDQGGPRRRRSRRHRDPRVRREDRFGVSTARSARRPTRRQRSATGAATRWTRPTAARPCARWRSISTKGPTCSSSSRRCRRSTSSRLRARVRRADRRLPGQRRVRPDRGRRTNWAGSIGDGHTSRPRPRSPGPEPSFVITYAAADLATWLREGND